MIDPPSGVNLMALITRFSMTADSFSRSAISGGRFGVDARSRSASRFLSSSERTVVWICSTSEATGEALQVEGDAPDVHAREVQQRADGARQPLQVALHDHQALLLLVGDGAELPLQDVVRVALDGGERRAQLVADVGQQVGLHPVELLQLLVDGRQLLVRLLELARRSP